jgi:hypothetical protein
MSVWVFFSCDRCAHAEKQLFFPIEHGKITLSIMFFEEKKKPFNVFIGIIPENREKI